MQLQSAPNLLPDWQGLQPCCTYLGRNHVILKNQVICKVSLQGHRDGVESAKGRHSEANALRLGQTPHPTWHLRPSGSTLGESGGRTRTLFSPPIPSCPPRLLDSCYQSPLVHPCNPVPRHHAGPAQDWRQEQAWLGVGLPQCLLDASF